MLSQTEPASSSRPRRASLATKRALSALRLLPPHMRSWTDLCDGFRGQRACLARRARRRAAGPSWMTWHTRRAIEACRRRKIRSTLTLSSTRADLDLVPMAAALREAPKPAFAPAPKSLCNIPEGRFVVATASGKGAWLAQILAVPADRLHAGGAVGDGYPDGVSLEDARAPGASSAFLGRGPKSGELHSCRRTLCLSARHPTRPTLTARPLPPPPHPLPAVRSPLGVLPAPPARLPFLGAVFASGGRARRHVPTEFVSRGPQRRPPRGRMPQRS